MYFCGPALQPVLSLDHAVGHHFATQGKQEDHQHNGVYIMGNIHQLYLLVLYPGGDCIDPYWRKQVVS